MSGARALTFASLREDDLGHECVTAIEALYDRGVQFQPIKLSALAPALIAAGVDLPPKALDTLTRNIHKRLQLSSRKVRHGTYPVCPPDTP